jgi:hypothetical protein
MRAIAESSAMDFGRLLPLEFGRGAESLTWMCPATSSPDDFLKAALAFIARAFTREAIATGGVIPLA